MGVVATTDLVPCSWAHAFLFLFGLTGLSGGFHSQELRLQGNYFWSVFVCVLFWGAIVLLWVFLGNAARCWGGCAVLSGPGYLTNTGLLSDCLLGLVHAVVVCCAPSSLDTARRAHGLHCEPYLRATCLYSYWERGLLTSVLAHP